MKRKKICKNCGHNLSTPRAKGLAVLREYTGDGSFCIGNYDSEGHFIMTGKLCGHNPDNELGTPKDMCCKCDIMI